MANRFALADFEDKTKQSFVTRLCKTFFPVYHAEFEDINLFSCEDLEQEVWCKLFESNSYDGKEGQFESYVDGILKGLIHKGSRREEIISIVPLSHLNAKDQRKATAELYGE